MTHLLFHPNSRLRFTPIILLNKALQIHNITQNTNTVHFQTPTPPSPTEIQTSTYTPAQTNPVQTTQPTLNVITIHSNPSFNYTTSRHLSRPPLQPILSNPLSYNLTSTNPQVIHNNLRPIITDPF